MAGHMRQRGDNSWQLLVHVGTDGTGKKRYASRTVRGTKRQAERALAEFVAEVAKGALVASGPVSVQQVVEGWLAAETPRITPSTVSRSRVALNHIIIPAIATVPVARLPARDVEDFYGALDRGGQPGTSPRRSKGGGCAKRVRAAAMIAGVA